MTYKAKMTVRTPFTSEELDAAMKACEDTGFDLKEIALDFDSDLEEAFKLELL